MSKAKPLPITLKRLKKLVEAFVIFSKRTGVKVVITIEPDRRSE